MAAARFRDRLSTYITEKIKNPDEIINVGEAAIHLRKSSNEYARRDVPSMTRQVAAALDALYSDVSGLANVRKPHYRKRDVVEIIV